MLYDLIFLAVFCTAVFLFLYSHRKNLGREGWMYMYRTKLGLVKIEEFSKKHSKLLHILKYPIVVVGFVLMITMIYLLCKTVYIYIAFPQISEIIKAPPVMPLIPYFTQIFGVESFMPPFYFAYFLIALVVVAVVHEFSHGIYMRLFKTKIKSTGFAFLGPILGAFVEQDDKDFHKKKNFEQMVVLGAGVFANILFALLFFLILIIFFYASYSPAGYIFGGYAYNAVNVSEISGTGRTIDGLTEIFAGNRTYLYSGNSSDFIEKLGGTNAEYVLLYENAPAIKNNISGAIIGIDNQKIKTRDDISFYLQDKKPGDSVLIETETKSIVKIYNITLAENPLNSSVGFMGIMSIPKQTGGIFEKIVSTFKSFRDDSVYYRAKYNPDFAFYIYNLLWWIMMINLFVGLFNMLPLGILDGGRFFYLSILILVKDKKIAEKSFKWATRLIGLIFLIMILAWIFSLI